MASTYNRALKQLKNKTFDKKSKLLEDIPTNNTTNLYVDVPSDTLEVPGEIDSPLDLTKDGDGVEGYTGNDTSGLFTEDGTIRAVEPPGNNSYVLGPMMSMWYGWGGFTQIGYVRQSDRRMVNLARINGRIENWDGESGFTSYGQLTVEQAKWYRDQPRGDYRAFYPGPPSNPADTYGRYLGSMVISSKDTRQRVFVPGTNRTYDPSDNYSAQRPYEPLDPNEGRATYDPVGELVILGVAFVAAKGFILMVKAVGIGALARVRNVLSNIKPKPKPRTYKKIEYPKSDPMDKVLRDIDRAGRSLQNKPRTDPTGPVKKRFPVGNSFELSGNYLAEGLEELPIEFIPIVSNMLADMGGYSAENIDKLIKFIDKYMKKTGGSTETTVKESRSKEVILENRKRILRDLKKPVTIKEAPKKFKYKPQVEKNKSVGADMMKVPDTPKQYKPPTNMWSKKDYYKNVKSSQEKKNEVLELVGSSEHHWTYLTVDKRKKSQEKVNEMMAAEFDKQIEVMYEKYKSNEKKSDKLSKYLNNA
tara:strand:- start:252 stop:1844 length:1593 start_codon:yes stop_codon:yes gene_type:complete